MGLGPVSKNIPLLLFLSAACLLAGLGLCFIEQAWIARGVVLSVVGTIAFFIGTLKCRKLSKPLNLTSWRKGLGIFMLYALLLCFFIGVNVIGKRFDHRWDLTQAKQHTLTEETGKVLSEIKRDIRITALHVDTPPKYLEDLFKEYERASRGKITTEIIDPLVQLSYAAQFGNLVNSREKKVIVQAGNERSDIDFTETPLTEEELNNALVRITRKARRAYFLAGHDESRLFDDDNTGLSTLAKHLLANNIISKSLMIETSGGIPEDCDLLVIAGVKKPLLESEEEAINKYLEGGGDALFLIEHMLVTTPDKPLTEDELERNPSLNEILEDWGITVNNDIVVDIASHASGDVGSPATRNYLPHKAIVKGLDYTFYVRPRSISLVADRRPSIKLVPLVLTASDEQSWGETDRMLNIKYDAGEDKAGPVPIAYVLMEPHKEEDLSDTRIVVFTDADFLTNVYIDRYSNADMALNTINWLTELDYQVLKDKRAIKVEMLNLTSKQKRSVAMILFAMPMFIAVSGMSVWVRQKL